MAFDLVIHEEAERSYAQIVEYLDFATGGKAASRRFAAEFDRQLLLIADNPMVYGLSRLDELASLGYRVALVNTYLMLYYVTAGEVHVAHVFHQSQDYARYVV